MCPNYLYTYNPVEDLKRLCDYRKEQSRKRIASQEKKRGVNLLKFKRSFEIGDVVRFNLDGRVRFGKIQEKNGSFNKVTRIDNQKKYNIHSKELEKTSFPEDYLKSLLDG